MPGCWYEGCCGCMLPGFHWIWSVTYFRVRRNYEFWEISNDIKLSREKDGLRWFLQKNLWEASTGFKKIILFVIQIASTRKSLPSLANIESNYFFFCKESSNKCWSKQFFLPAWHWVSVSENQSSSGREGDRSIPMSRSSLVEELCWEEAEMGVQERAAESVRNEMM